MTKNFFLKSLLPHIIVIILFWIISAIYFKPVFDGNVLSQQDTAAWVGSSKQSLDYAKEFGRPPLWNISLFSGMPNYFMLGVGGKSVLPDFQKIASLGLPYPANLFFIACALFYLLAILLGANPITAAIIGFSYGYATYNPIIIEAGHYTKMGALAFFPLAISGIILLLRGRYWLGIALSAIGLIQVIAFGHHQVTYYCFLLIGFIFLFQIIQWLRDKQWKQIGISVVCFIISAGVAIGVSALSLLTQQENSKATMRGGKTVEIQGGEVVAAKTKGLDNSYAFTYSIKKAETVVLFMPNAFGTSSGTRLPEENKVQEKLVSAGIPESNAMQISQSLPAYWGGMAVPGEGTAGPFYIGAIIFLLGLLGFVLVPGPLKWGLLAATIFAFLLAWGKYFPGFNNLIFEYLPMYDKFRAPSMIMVIPQITFPIMAVLFLNEIFSPKGAQFLSTHFKAILYSLGGLVVLLGALYLLQDYSSGYDSEIKSSFQQQGADQNMISTLIAGLKSERSSQFGGQILRTIGFILLILAGLYATMKNWIKPLILTAILGVVLFIDIWSIDRKYLNNDSFKPKEETNNNDFPKDPAVEQILADKDPQYRVFNAAPDRFSENYTSYYLRSVGGYSAAKLRVYQDIIELYLSANPNQEVLNALNTKYFLIPDPQTNKKSVIANKNAYGPAWFVSSVISANDDVQAIKEVGRHHLKDTAIVQNVAAMDFGIKKDTAATLKLSRFSNDTLIYNSKSNSPQFAVFSEVYYPYGWNAYIDGKKTDIIKTNYFMRGLRVPTGNHEIKFVLEPDSIAKGTKIGFISSIIALILILVGFFMSWWSARKIGNRDIVPAK